MENKTKKIVKFRMHMTEQWRDFDSQTEARESAIKLLRTGLVFFINLERIEVEEK